MAQAPILRVEVGAHALRVRSVPREDLRAYLWCLYFLLNVHRLSCSTWPTMGLGVTFLGLEPRLFEPLHG